MNKKLLALAVAGAFAAPWGVSVPQAAAADNVTIYGRLNVDFENVDGDTPASPSRFRVSSNSSALGFKGSEDLGGGLKAIFQIESNIAMDGVSGAGSGAFQIGSRDTWVGLSGNFGTVQLGSISTPFKLSTLSLDPWLDTGVGGYTGVFANGTVTTASNGGALTAGAFDVRAQNSLQYTTPDMNGFKAALLYSANEGKSDVTNLNPRLWSLAGTYGNGPLYLTLAYERHDDPGTVAAIKDKKDDAWKLGGSYKFPSGTKVGLAYSRIRYERTNDYTLHNWYLDLEQDVGGAGTMLLTYARAGSESCAAADAGGLGGFCAAVGGGSDNGARLWTVGYKHHMSKRTDLYAIYSRIDNDSQAAYDFATNGVAPNPGGNPRAFGLGIVHYF